MNGLSVLIFFLPFEPRGLSLPLGPFEITLLEALAATVTIATLVAFRPRVAALLAAPPLPLILIAAYALAHGLSAVLAQGDRGMALKFAARMAAMSVFAWAVAASPPRSRRAGTAALVAAGIAVAALSILEGAGVRALDSLLDLFRETPFNVGGARRATAGSEYPTQAAVFLAAGLLAWAGLAGRVALAVGFVVAGVLSAGLLFTYSRGPVVAAGGALLVMLALADRNRRAVIAVLGALALAVVAFALQGEVFRLRLGAEGTQDWYAARYEPEEKTLRIGPGERRRTTLRVTNTGQKTWSRLEAFRLSYHWYDLDRRTLQDGGRTELPRDMAPGETTILEPAIVAPDRAGRYLLLWDMVHEHTTWFSGQGVRPGTVPAFVGEAPSSAGGGAPAMADLAWQPRRAELWRLAVLMWRDHPVLGVGSDNFRWLYGTYAGRQFWDRRVYANNTVLEAAATTGSLGALALALTYAATLGAAFRRLRMATPGSLAAGEALALFGVALGLSAHGLVDYVLAFTGHYLLFGFVVGAISAPFEETDLA